MLRSSKSSLTRRAFVMLKLAALGGVCLPATALAAGAIQNVETAEDTGESEQQSALVVTQDDGAGEEIVVTGSRASRLRAIDRKRELPVIADVIASDLIGRLPDYNTAEALQRLPGVSVEIDQGEARYVVIRGVDPNLNQVTIDGNLVGIPEAEGRRVALDTIPSDLVAAIEVVKAVTPDYDANAIGGSINIVTPTAYDRPDDFVFVTAKGSYAEKADKLGFGGSGTYGTKFGADDQFGIVVAGSYFKRFIHSDLAEPVSWFQLSEDVVTPAAYRLYDYRIMRERIGGIVNLDFRPNNDVRLYVRNIYNEFTDKEERDQLDYAFARGTPSFPSANQISFSRGRATREYRQNDQTQKLYNVSPGAELTFGAVQLDLNYTYAHAEEVTPVRDDIEFRSADNLGSTLDLDSSMPKFSELNPSIYDADAFPLMRVRQRQEDIKEDLHAMKVDVQYNFGDFGDNFVKVGAKYTERRKTRDNRQNVLLPTEIATLGGTGLALGEPDDFYEGDYRFGPTIDYRGLLDLIENNPGLVALDGGSTLNNDFSSDYGIDEFIYAGYGMASLTFGDLTAVGGVRVERTEATYNAFEIRETNQSGATERSDIRRLSFQNSYTDVLPSVHLTYKPLSKLIARAAWTNTIGRPNYDASVPTFEEDGGEGTAGNPDLKPFKSMGLDGSLEFYPDRESVLSAAIFYKKIENPVFTRLIFNTSFAGVPLTELSQPQNATDGDIFGVEVNAVRRFNFLPAPFDGLGASVNGTWVDSSVTVPGRENEDIPFFRQSDWIANAALFYEKGPFEARFAVSFRDDFIVNIGNSTASDVYNKDRTLLDARFSYRITEGIEIFSSISNIGDAPLTYFQTNEDQVYSRQIYSFNADFGISANF
ncbi:TonB-dependent receptor [Pacificimonas sp. ICDLI1SI03]